MVIVLSINGQIIEQYLLGINNNNKSILGVNQKNNIDRVEFQVRSIRVMFQSLAIPLVVKFQNPFPKQLEAIESKIKVHIMNHLINIMKNILSINLNTLNMKEIMTIRKQSDTNKDQKCTLDTNQLTSQGNKHQ